MNITLVQKYPSRILLRIETDFLCLQIQTSSIVFDPFEELYIWLGMIRDRQLPTTMAIVGEGHGVTLNAKLNDSEHIDFTIEQCRYWDKQKPPVYLKKCMKAEELVQCFYDGVTEFIKERYVIQASTFVVLSNLNWDSLLTKPDIAPNWKMRLAMYGGGGLRVPETGIDTIETTLEQQELYNLRNFLYFVSTTSRDQIGMLADLYKTLPVDIALGEIDSDWYQKRKQEIEDEYKVYDLAA